MVQVDAWAPLQNKQNERQALPFQKVRVRSKEVSVSWKV